MIFPVYLKYEEHYPEIDNKLLVEKDLIQPC